MQSLEHDYAHLHNIKFTATRPHHTEDDVQGYIRAKQLYNTKMQELVDAIEQFKHLASLGNDYQEVPAMNQEQQHAWLDTLNEYKLY